MFLFFQGRRPYSCEYCGQCFAAHTNLSNHRWKHLRTDDDDDAITKPKRSGKRLAPSELLPAKGRLLPIINDKEDKSANETTGWKKVKEGYIRHFKRGKRRSSGFANISRKKNRVIVESNKNADESNKNVDESPLKKLEANDFQLEIADIRSLSTESPVTIKQERPFTYYDPADSVSNVTVSSSLPYGDGHQSTTGNQGVYMDIDVNPLVKSSPASPYPVTAEPDLPPLPQVLDCYVADSQLFRCSFCDVYYVERGHYFLHAALHSANNPWKCSVCNITFNGKDEFALHFITHKHCGNV